MFLVIGDLGLSKLIRRENCPSPPFFDHLRELLNYGIAKTCVRSQSFNSKGIANSKLLLD